MAQAEAAEDVLEFGRPVAQALLELAQSAVVCKRNPLSDREGYIGMHGLQTRC